MNPVAPQRLLIVRMSAMGDAIHAMPAVAALRREHPALHIGWAIDPEWAPLLVSAEGDHPLVDAIHRVPFKKWSRRLHQPGTWAEILASRRDLAAAHYDVALDLQGSVRSACVLRWSRAARQIGEAAPRESIARFLYKERVAHSGEHVIEQDLELVSAIFGKQLAYTPPAFPQDAAAEQEAEAWLRAHPATRHAMLLPGAGWGAKRWPAERFGAVASGLRDAGFHCFINAGPGEEDLAAAVVAASQGSASVVRSTLTQLIALLRRTALCIGGDTGPLHLASALAVPVVGIYGPTDAARNGPFGAPHCVLRHAASVRDHSRKPAPDPSLLTITPQDVLAAAHELLLKGAP